MRIALAATAILAPTAASALRFLPARSKFASDVSGGEIGNASAEDCGGGVPWGWLKAQLQKISHMAENQAMLSETLVMDLLCIDGVGAKVLNYLENSWRLR